MRSVLKWADGKVIKEVVDAKIENVLGPKTGEDLAPATREPKQTPGRGDKVPSKQVNNNNNNNNSINTLKQIFFRSEKFSILTPK